MSSRLVSIVLPTHNGMRYLQDALDSCLAQTYSPIELVIVNDGSKDGTSEFLDSLTHPSIKVVHHPTNYGLPAALNTGFANTTGEYLSWTSDDNLLMPQTIAELAACLDDNPDVDFVYAPYVRIDDDGEIINTAELGPPEELEWRNPVGACFLYRRRVYELVGDFNPAARLAEDTEYWLRIYVNFKMMFLDKPLYYYRLHRGSLTSTNFNAFAAMRVSAGSRRRILGIAWPHYARQMSQAYIEETFARYAAGDLSGARHCVWKGLAYNPSWVRNRGVVSVAMKSTFGRKSDPTPA